MRLNASILCVQTRYIVFLLVIFLFSLTCSCYKPGDGQALARTLISAGFNPPNLPSKDELKNAKMLKVTEERNSYQFGNGAFGVDKNGKLVHLFIYNFEYEFQLRRPPLPNISIQASDGTDFLSLTKGQFLSLYGNPNRPDAKGELREPSFRYEYKSGADIFITLVVIFKGKANDSKMSSVSGSCIYGKLAEQVFQMNPGVKYLAWPG